MSPSANTRETEVEWAAVLSWLSIMASGPSAGLQAQGLVDSEVAVSMPCARFPNRTHRGEMLRVGWTSGAQEDPATKTCPSADTSSVTLGRHVIPLSFPVCKRGCLCPPSTSLGCNEDALRICLERQSGNQWVTPTSPLCPAGPPCSSEVLGCLSFMVPKG